MRQRLLIIATVVVVLGLLIVLNAASYVQNSNPEQMESELAPNRSTYHSGATGTRALYDLLNESGYNVTRWRETPKLLTKEGTDISTFVVIGSTLVPFEEEEATDLLAWVSSGGRLVLIDRRPETKLLHDSNGWTINIDVLEYPSGAIDPSKPKDMTDEVNSVRPVQPTVLTRAVESVKPSRFASVARFSYGKPVVGASEPMIKVAPDPTYEDEEEETDETEHGKQPPPRSATKTVSKQEQILFPAPVVHLRDRRGALLLDYGYGKGRITVLTDPYIVANGGIQLEDNLQLAVNTIAGRGGKIAFDEFHQGRASSRNEFAAYFQGTPVLALAGQLVLLTLVVLWTQGRRFGRPLPLPQVDRRSSLEFVASMAELQHRARAYDLAIENIYSRTRRVLTRYAGVDYHSSRAEIVERIAARSSVAPAKLEAVMRDCEEAINGGAINERQAIALVRRLREIEGALGLRMRSRELKQAAEQLGP